VSRSKHTVHNRALDSNLGTGQATDQQKPAHSAETTEKHDALHQG
jgi:hypothetical protein